jgi:hypothetical protein
MIGATYQRMRKTAATPAVRTITVVSANRRSVISITTPQIPSARSASPRIASTFETLSRFALSLCLKRSRWRALGAIMNAVATATQIRTAKYV